MADHMHWAALFLSAFVAFICDCKPLDGYKFPVYTTELCPRNQTEWMERSSAINCTESNGYLCLPSEDLNELLEFCYFEYQIPIAKGLCMFLRKRDSFIDAYNCRNFVEGCPNSTYRMYEVNKYRSCVSIGNSCFLAEPACIRTASIEETNNTMHEFIPFQERNDGVWILTFLGVSIGALIIVPVIMFYRKMKRKDDIEKVVVEKELLSKCNGHTKENGTEKEQIYNDQKSDVKEEKMIQFRSLSGCTETRCSLKGVRTIGDLRNALSIKLQIPRPFVLIVDRENGLIFNDETVIENLKHQPTELMIGNQNRKKDDDEDEDESVKYDVISNRRITSGKCQMSCGHFTAPDSLYEWTKEKLPCSTDEGLLCPKCRCWRWEIDELIRKCNMSRDEIIFYKQVASLHERTAKDLEKARRKQKNKSRSLPVFLLT